MIKTSSPDRLNLAHLPTPVHILPSISKKFHSKVYIKRDDMTGLLLSGNKIRKLEFLLADAKKKGCDLVITAGGIQSNHSRATIIASGMAGLPSVALLNGKPPEYYAGNTLLDRYFGARIHFLTEEEYARIPEVLTEYGELYRKKGYNPYLIPVGGSNATGCWGYVTMFRELVEQEKQLGFQFDVICHAVGSGGTLSGMILGKQVTGHPARIIGINVCDSAEYFHGEVERIVAEAADVYGFSDSIPWGDVEIIDGYVGPGYAKIDDDNMEKLICFSRKEGIIFDHVYTGKALLGLLGQIEYGTILKDNNILFVHTGGMFAVFAENEQISRIVDRIDNFDLSK